MTQRHHHKDRYHGFEQGPIRPPSEAGSLLVRVTRNCPWNHCAFCPVYKGARFSIRPEAHVIDDIDAAAPACGDAENELPTNPETFCVRISVNGCRASPPTNSRPLGLP